MATKLDDSIDVIKERIEDFSEDRTMRNLTLGLVGLILVMMLVVAFYWSSEPEMFSVQQIAGERAEELGIEPVTGFTSTVTLQKVAETLLDKPGGYLHNDVLPPSVFLDNIPNWEFGVIVQVRDFSRALRKDFSRSQSQSVQDKDLEIAEPQFHFDNDSWAVPSTESAYREAIDAIESYSIRLANPIQTKAQFYARADNLRTWLMDVETRLGSLSQRLSSSVGRPRLNTDLAGDSAATQSTKAPKEEIIKTSWFEIDDVFYEARGSAWALLHLLKAVEVDFQPVLEKKNALISLRQIIRELEATQETVMSPMILNGSGFGMTANHSLVMASYISRANAAIIDLRGLLEQG